MANRDGGVADYTDTCGIVEGKLYGFAVNSVELKEQHIRWLDEFVVPILEDGGSVSLVGEASRTGSASYNKLLSQRRAQKVLEHLQLQQRTAFSRYDLGSVSAVGELAAKKAGLRDGTEDAFYRAVLVRAWGKPNVPAPPQPKPDLPKTVRRVVMRRWVRVSSRTPRTGSPAADGELGAALADLVKKAYDTSTKGGSDDRHYAVVDADYVVVSVHEKYSLTEIGGLGVTTTTTSREIRYTWGPYSPTVTLHKEDRFHPLISKEPRETRSITIHPRSEIWKRTTAPDANVFG